MSVVKSKRDEGELVVVTKANELATYTIKICSNEANFPKRYRWCITNKIVDAALEINNQIIKANSVFVKDQSDYELRKKYQTEGLAATYSLLSMIDIGYRIFGIDSKRIKHWTGLVLDVQNLMRNWRKRDIERYKNLG
jgi:hypothetical protein